MFSCPHFVGWHDICLYAGMNIAQKTKSVPWVNQGSPQPIARWLEAIKTSGDRYTELLRKAYLESWPTQGELIFSGACEFTCQHCIYPPSFARANRGLSVEQWDWILENIAQNLGIRTFVYGGRSLSAEGLEVLTGLRRRFPDAQIGLIDNGISMLPLRDRLADVQAEWIDVSLDGQEKEHDLQRGRSGSFRAGLEGVQWLVRNGIAPKVNILTCLTTINQASVIPMIQELNAMGLKNFFIIPVTVAEGMGPSPELRVSAEDFARFVAELRAVMPLLDDAWVELNCFSAEYAEYIAQKIPDIWKQLSSDREGLSWGEKSVGVAHHCVNELYVRYYPTSLTGTRELIVNTNGDVIVPKSMAAGIISKNHVIGNLLQQEAHKIVEGLPESPEFSFYEQEFLHEQNLLRRYL
jgi:MoaA/NifB/PqqE/SkfB family radical SAM enzyme